MKVETSYYDWLDNKQKENREELDAKFKQKIYAIEHMLNGLYIPHGNVDHVLELVNEVYKETIYHMMGENFLEDLQRVHMAEVERQAKIREFGEQFGKDAELEVWEYIEKLNDEAIEKEMEE